MRLQDLVSIIVTSADLRLETGWWQDLPSGFYTGDGDSFAIVTHTKLEDTCSWHSNQPQPFHPELFCSSRSD